MKDASIPPPQFPRRFTWPAAALFCLIMVASACTSEADQAQPGESDGAMVGAVADAPDDDQLEVAPTSARAGAGSADDGESGSGDQVEGPEAATYPAICQAGSITAAGPAPVEAIVRRAAELYLRVCPEVELTVDRVDAELGFTLLCAGQIDVVGAGRAPTDAERSACADNGIEPMAIPLATEALVVVAGPDGAVAECLGYADLYALLGADSVGFTRWTDAATLGAEAGSALESYPDAALDVFAPAVDDADRLGFEEMVLGPVAALVQSDPTVRSDLVGVRAIGDLIDGLATSPSAIGWMSFDLATANASSLTPVALRRTSEDPCAQATAATVADGSYPAARHLDLHVAVPVGGATDAEATPPEPQPAAAFVRYLFGDSYPVVVGAANGSTGYLTRPEQERRAALAAWADR